MQTVIGVYHVEENREKLVDFVIENYGVPKSLMLELPTYWQELDYFKKTYFYFLADRFKARGTRIVAGDRESDLVVPKSFCEKIQELESKKSVLRKFFWLKYFAHEIRKNLSNTKVDRLRNISFLEAFEEENPELTIVGDDHARFIKDFCPGVEYVHFRSNTPLEDKLFYKKNSSEFIIKPDREVVVDVKWQ